MRIVGLLLFALVVVPSWSSAQVPDGQTEDRAIRGELSLGLQQWDELAQLEPSNGRFDATGINLGGAVHWRMRQLGNRSLLFGLDAAVFTNESNVRHITEDVTARGLHLTSSVKLRFDDGTGPRYSLDFGLGYYLVDIAEVKIYDFGGYSEDELWENSDFGGYVGATIDFRSRRSDRAGFFMSTKIHFLDLGNVSDEGSSIIVPPTLGSDAGALTGPVVMLQFGYHWF